MCVYRQKRERRTRRRALVRQRRPLRTGSPSDIPELDIVQCSVRGWPDRISSQSAPFFPPHRKTKRKKKNLFRTSSVAKDKCCTKSAVAQTDTSSFKSVRFHSTVSSLLSRQKLSASHSAPFRFPFFLFLNLRARHSRRPPGKLFNQMT